MFFLPTVVLPSGSPHREHERGFVRVALHVSSPGNARGAGGGGGGLAATLLAKINNWNWFECCPTNVLIQALWLCVQVGLRATGLTYHSAHNSCQKLRLRRILRCQAIAAGVAIWQFGRASHKNGSLRSECLYCTLCPSLSTLLYAIFNVTCQDNHSLDRVEKFMANRDVNDVATDTITHWACATREVLARVMDGVGLDPGSSAAFTDEVRYMHA